MPTTARRVRLRALAGSIVVVFFSGSCSRGPGGSEGQPPPATPAPTQSAAQQPVAQCPPGGFGNTTVIELAETKGVCAAVINGGDKIGTIWTNWGSWAYWDVCNRCTNPVDIKLRRWSSDPSVDFQYTFPMINAANEIELLSVGTYPSAGGSIRGRLNDGPRERASREYQLSWRATGTLPWTDIDPRLEIERDHFALWEGLLKNFGSEAAALTALEAISQT